MLNIDKKQVYTLFILISLLTASILAVIYSPASAQSSDEMYLHGPSLKPIHMHSNITLNPIHMHHTQGILWPGEYPLTEPNCTTDWQLITPDVDPPFEKWHLSSWEDLGEPFGELSPNDQIDMTNWDTQEVEWFHVDRITLTLNLSGPFPFPNHEPGPTSLLLELKWPFYDPTIVYQPVGTMWHEVWPLYSPLHGITHWIDDPFFPDGQLSFTDAISFDGGFSWWHVEDIATDLILRWKMMDPIGTGWHELYPDYCNQYEITSWDSYPDPYCDRISNKDLIDMWDFTTQQTRWYFVDRVTITINVTSEQTQDWMMLELKTYYFEEMYYWIKHPVGSMWHAVYPEDVYCTVYELTYWDLMDQAWDNCNGVLDPCDHVILTNQDSGLDELYHITDMAYDIILNEYITDPIGTAWHELHPDCSLAQYDVIDFEDNGDLWLSPSDNITLADPTGFAEEYHVDNVTLTLNVTVLDPFGGAPFTVGELLYFEHLEGLEEPWNYTWPRLYHPKIEPLDTDWQIVCPIDYFGNIYTISDWFDNCNGVIDYCDTLILYGPAGEGVVVHVEEIAVDIKVMKLAPALVHDVAVIDVFSIYDWVYQGDIDPINVTVQNQGDYTESTTVTAYYNGVPAAPSQIILLNAGESRELTFNWDTTGVTPGFYQVSADASIAVDNDQSNNFMTGNTEEVKLRPPWYKKPPYPDYAPSGMPDFDQKQNGWFTGNGWTHCGPVAVANSLWWFDSQYEPNNIGPPAIIDNFPLVTAYGAWDDHDPQNVVPLVDNLAFLMDTNGMRTGLTHTGTGYIDMQTGISQYLQQQGINPVGDCDGDGDVDAVDIAIINAALGSTPFAGPWDMRADIVVDNIVNAVDLNVAIANVGQVGMFYEHTEDFPDFFFIEEEVERCQDVVLLLSFWQEIAPEVWEPVEYPFDLPSGGHYVTVAGVNSSTQELLLSDPWWDAAHYGWPGDIPTPHGGPHGVAVHNDAQFVSHDAYGTFFWPGIPPFSPYPGQPVWELVGYLQQLGYPPTFRAFIRAAVITSPLEGHDVAVTNITTSKTGCLPMETVGNGTTANVTVTFENQGGFTETFNATAKANGIVIGAQLIVLNAGQNITITFVWDTTGFAHGDYLISAEAEIVPGETDTADNTMNYGIMRVTWAGDVDGDSDVDIFDIVRMATIYGVEKPDPAYDPNCDLDNDGDIDIFDIVRAAGNYGK